jgi:amino acid permease
MYLLKESILYVEVIQCCGLLRCYQIYLYYAMDTTTLICCFVGGERADAVHSVKLARRDVVLVYPNSLRRTIVVTSLVLVLVFRKTRELHFYRSFLTAIFCLSFVFVFVSRKERPQRSIYERVAAGEV